MKFQSTLKKSKLIKRYKRFLAEIETYEGKILTIYCPNTGSMIGCANKNSIIWYSTSKNTKRKYQHTWELTEQPQGHLISINTLLANNILEEAIEKKLIPELEQYNSIKKEIKYGSENSKIDFLLSKNTEKCFIEIKSVTLCKKKCGYFPDAISKRGQKHIRELQSMIKAGHRAILFFMVLHTNIYKVTPAYTIDPIYANLLLKAQKKYGLEILCYKCNISTKEIQIYEKIPFIK